MLKFTKEQKLAIYDALLYLYIKEGTKYKEAFGLCLAVKLIDVEVEMPEYWQTYKSVEILKALPELYRYKPFFSNSRGYWIPTDYTGYLKRMYWIVSAKERLLNKEQ